MLPLGLAVLLFALFTLFGKAVLELVQFRMPVLRRWLIAPTVGFALIEIVVCFFNQLCNLPVKEFAVWTLLGMTLCSAVILRWKRAIFPVRQLAPFGCVLAFSLLYTGWPALVRGFDWLSYVNGDMTYFSAGAVRMLEHPFYAMPSLADLVGRDYTQFTWAAHVMNQVRSGGEMLLAWCAGVIGLNPVRAYMPLILALQLVQLCAAGALVIAKPYLRKFAFFTMVMLSLSPLFSLGALYQLLPQSGGIPAMLVLALLLVIDPNRLRHSLAYCVVLAIVLSGLFLHYPEVIAFGVASAILYRARRALLERRISLVWVGCMAGTFVLVCVMIREALLAGIVNTLGNVQNAGLTGVTPGNSIFPYFLIPSGLTNLFGLLPIGRLPAAPVLSALIMVALVLLTVIVVEAAVGLRRGDFHSYFLAFTFLVGLTFFWGANDYGLFKLAMFCQPLLAACLASLLIRMPKPWSQAFVIMTLACTVYSQSRYTLMSAGLKGGGVVEVPDISAYGLDFAVPKVTAISDIALMPAQGLAAIIFRGSQVLYPSVARGKFLSSPESEPAGLVADQHTRESGSAAPCLSETVTCLNAVQGEAVSDSRFRDQLKIFLNALRQAATFPVERFRALGEKQEQQRKEKTNIPYRLWNSDFWEYAPNLSDGNSPLQLLTLKRAFLFNTASPLKNPRAYGIFQLVPFDEIRNRLMFIPSSRGPDYYYGRFNASFYQPEPDPYRPGSFMSSLGAFLMLEVLHPTQPLRLHISFTRSILGASQVILPQQATINGESSTRVSFVGAGSAGVYSAPIWPVWRNGHAYVAIDFGMQPASFPNVKTGLMRLYNREFAIDHRKVIGFGRDVSAISEKEYEELRRPRRVENFPSGLLSDPGLEYAGIYEDGWVSDESYVKLAAPQKNESVIVEGMIPAIASLANGRLKIIVQINNGPTQEQTLKPGSFRIKIGAKEPAQQTVVHMRFSDRIPLPGGDGRLVSALLRSIALQ